MSLVHFRLGPLFVLKHSKVKKEVLCSRIGLGALEVLI